MTKLFNEELQTLYNIIQTKLLPKYPSNNITIGYFIDALNNPECSEFETYQYFLTLFDTMEQKNDFFEKVHGLNLAHSNEIYASKPKINFSKDIKNLLNDKEDDDTKMTFERLLCGMLLKEKFHNKVEEEIINLIKELNIDEFTESVLTNTIKYNPNSVLGLEKFKTIYSLCTPLEINLNTWDAPQNCFRENDIQRLTKAFYKIDGPNIILKGDDYMFTTIEFCKRIAEEEGFLLLDLQKYAFDETLMDNFCNELNQHEGSIIVIRDINNLILNAIKLNEAIIFSFIKYVTERCNTYFIGMSDDLDYEDIPYVKQAFKCIEIDRFNKEETLENLKNNKKYIEKIYGVTCEDKILEDIVDIVEKYEGSDFLFNSAYNFIDEASVNVKLDGGAELTSIYIQKNIEEEYGKKKPLKLKCEIGNLKNLNKELKKLVKGQDKIIDIVVKNVQRKQIGLSGKKRPASFMFVGTTGVGKTYLTKELSRLVYGENKLIKVDMSEFSESHSVSKLYGAPPGYIGYEDKGNSLVAKIKENPNCVLLFDEVEKAHESIFNVLLQVIDEGILTTGKGETIDFSNTIIVMTSNCGTQKAMEKKTIGFGEIVTDFNGIIDKELKHFFKPEFLNRIDHILTFNILKDEDLKEIINKELDALISSLREKDIVLGIHNRDGMIDYILSELHDEKNYGARSINRKIAKLVEIPILDEVIENENTDINIEFSNKEIKIINLEEYDN